MTKPTLRIDGADDLRRALRAVEGGISDLRAAHADAALVVQERAQQIVPRRTGRLAASIRSSGQARQGVVRSGSAAVPYAGVIHFGWPGHNISPQPFLYAAVDERHDQVLEVYERRVNEIVKQHGLD